MKPKLFLFFTPFLITNTLCACSSNENMKINNNQIDKYKIIYAENPDTSFISQYPQYNVIDDLEFDKITATELQTYIQNKFGVTLDVCLDKDTDKSDYEIVIGTTNRSIGDYLIMSPYDMDIKVNKNSLYINGGSFGSTYQAMKQLMNQLDKKPTIPANYSFKGKADLTTIACVGDSITEGASVYIEGVTVDFADNKKYFSYPVVLQRLFWKDCYVHQLGCSGSCVRADIVEHAYINTPQWNTLMLNGGDIDIALIMLGTNDSYWDTNKKLSDLEKQIFISSYEGMLQQMLEKNKNMKFTMFNCPITYGAPYSATQDVLDTQDMTYEYLINKNYPIQFYNMREATEQMDKSVFSDGVHLSSRGSGVVAQLIATIIEQQYNLKKS